MQVLISPSLYTVDHYDATAYVDGGEITETFSKTETLEKVCATLDAAILRRTTRGK